MKAEAKILVSNLDFDVNPDDVTEIFQRIGPVTSAEVNYDREGRSRGTAEVTFNNANHAKQAVEDYDGAEVDGRPMYLKLVGTIVQTKTVRPRQQNYQQNNYQQNNYQGGNQGGRRQGGNQGGNRGGRKQQQGGKKGGNNQKQNKKKGGKGGKKQQNNKPATSESLDAEMDAYFNNKGGDDAGAAAPAAQPKAAKAESSFTGQPGETAGGDAAAAE
jgi:THO complex subunit 4